MVGLHACRDRQRRWIALTEQNRIDLEIRDKNLHAWMGVMDLENTLNPKLAWKTGHRPMLGLHAQGR